MVPLHVVTGAAGFIGSHLVDVLLARGYSVLGVDNFTRGVQRNLSAALSNPRFEFREAAVHDEKTFGTVLEAIGGAAVQMVWHLAANSDIGAGTRDPDIDWRDTFMTSYVVAKMCRRFGIRNLSFASTSAIYGDHGPVALREDAGPLFPISNYGAMKLASEAVFTALSEGHLDHLWIFRFPNVVGGRATHGVIYDFLDKIENDRSNLSVLGNGTQCKPYLYVDDLIEAMMRIVDATSAKMNCFNIGPEDTGCPVQYIAETVVSHAAPGATIHYGTENRGWTGDVPQFHYSIDRLRELGWSPTHSSQAAIVKAVMVQLAERRERV